MSRFRESLIRFFKKAPVYAAVIWLILLAALVVLSDVILIPFVAGKFTSRREVPALVGLMVDEAESRLAAEGLGVMWAKEGRYSSEVPVGAVLVQVPAPGREVKKGRRVFLTVSKGVREVPVPDLRGQSRRQGEISIQRLGLHQGEDIAGSHASIPYGVIIRTVPESGKLIRVGDTVRLVISQGERSNRVALPNLTSLSLQQATETLSLLGLVLGEVKKDSSNQLPQTVLGQYPLPDEYLSLGDTVQLKVAE